MIQQQNLTLITNYQVGKIYTFTLLVDNFEDFGGCIFIILHATVNK